MAIKYCWATNRRASSLKGVMKLKEIGQNAVVCTTEKEPELCDGWLIPGRQIPEVSRHINKIRISEFCWSAGGGAEIRQWCKPGVVRGVRFEVIKV